jgi:hypothetical protein
MEDTEYAVLGPDVRQVRVCKVVGSHKSIAGVLSSKHSLLWV